MDIYEYVSNDTVALIEKALENGNLMFKHQKLVLEIAVEEGATDEEVIEHIRKVKEVKEKNKEIKFS